MGSLKTALYKFSVTGSVILIGLLFIQHNALKWTCQGHINCNQISVEPRTMMGNATTIKIGTLPTTNTTGYLLPEEGRSEFPKITSRRLFDYMSFYLRNKPYPGVTLYTAYTMTRLKVKLREDIQPIIPGLAPVINDVTSFNYTVEVPQCKPAPHDEISLFVVINSAPKNSLKRQSVRETWLPQLKIHLNHFKMNETKRIYLVGHAFYIGKSRNNKVNRELEKESEKNKDILQVDLNDSYYDLSIKVTSLLNWLSKKCTNVHFVLKVDDDIYVNVRNLASFIRQADLSSAYGTASDGIVRDIGKWKLYPHEYPWKSYPKYLQGGAVLLPGKVVRSLLAAAQTIPFHPFDDLYLTGFCAERAGVPLFTCDSFLDRLSRPAPGACFAFFTVTWLTLRLDQMRSSHVDVEQIYSNITQCRTTVSRALVDPSERVEFELIKL